MKVPAVWKITSVLIVGVLAISSSAVLVRLAMSAVGEVDRAFSLVLAASRLSVAALMLLPVWQGFQLRDYSPRALAYAGLAGMVLALHFAAWITALTYTSIAAATVLVTSNPIWVAFFSWLWFKEKPSRLTLGGIGVALTGAMIVACSPGNLSSGATQPWLGNGLALVGAWTISVYILCGRQAQHHGFSLRYYTAFVYSLAALILLPLPWLWGTGYGGYPGLVYGCIGLMALFPQLVGHTSINWAVTWTSPILVTLIILAEPIGASLLGYFVFGERPTLQVVAGSIVLLLGVLVAAIGSGAQTANAPQDSPQLPDQSIDRELEG